MRLRVGRDERPETLSIVDPDSGLNWAHDFLGNHGVLGAQGDGTIPYDDIRDVYVCDEETFEWWRKVLADAEALEARIRNLRRGHGPEAVDRVLCTVHVDLGDYAAAANQALSDAFGGGR